VPIQKPLKMEPKHDDISFGRNVLPEETP